MTSASPGGLSWSKPRAVRSMTLSKSSRLITTVSVNRGWSDTVCSPASGLESRRRTWGPSPRSTAIIVGRVGRAEPLAIKCSPVTSVASGSVTVNVAPEPRWTTCCCAVHEVRGSPSVAAYADPCTSIRSASPRARVRPGWAIRSASRGPCRALTHMVGVTSIRVGTFSVRLSVTGSSGASAIDAAQSTASSASAHPSRPSSSDPRSQAATAEPLGGGGTTTVCRRSMGWANPDASYWVTDSSVMPNCTPEVPSSVPTAVIRTHGVSP